MNPAANGPDPILRASDLHASIAGQEILHGVDLTVPAAGVTALLGRNGVGKSTTLKALIGLVERTGEIRFAGGRIDGALTHRIVRRGIGYVPEDREIFSRLTVAENLSLARRPGPAHDDLVAALFPDLLTRSAQLAGTLSGGQQQMLALARVLVNDNRLLLIDEPTKGLAPRVVTETTEVLAEVARTVPMLLVEQNLAVVRRLAHRVIVMAEGVVVHTGPAAALLDDPQLLQELLGVHRHVRSSNEIAPSGGRS